MAEGWRPMLQDFLPSGFVGGDRTDRPLTFLTYLRPWARHILTDDEARAIIRPVTTDEVKIAFFDIEEDKAPGVDGFSSGFFKAAWPVVGEEVSSAIIDFFKTGRLLKQLNATLLTLIPKVRTPHSVVEFRPISCCNVMYKVITKILVSWIRESLDLLISPSQNAFVPGRLISDNVLLAQELFSGWIEECVTSAHYSVVVNGGCMDSSRGQEDGEFRYHWRCQELKLFQLSFADDLLLLCKAVAFGGPPSAQISGSSTYFSTAFYRRLSTIASRLTAASKDGKEYRSPLLAGFNSSNLF
ncbi:hypothetical protein Sango_2888500 [Sesamum angolense]|uniref:Reverse transcriptase domain-containing protein n=1 Tax=Sesamum angolense TaxID=2727404 RepID=A0AAE1VW86_9LAMI|nr:hypothetical protein Sango_2888500 [Sesamum angolense]